MIYWSYTKPSMEYRVANTNCCGTRKSRHSNVTVKYPENCRVNYLYWQMPAAAIAYWISNPDSHLAKKEHYYAAI